MTPQRSTQYGFSLVELMIAMLIGLMLMSGIVSVFASSRKSFDLTQEISAIQESARFAMDALTNDIRMAGFQGCAMVDGESAEILANNAPTSKLFDTATRGAEVSGSTWSPIAPAELSVLNPAPVSGSDVLMLQFASPVSYRLQLPMTGVGAPIQVTSPNVGLRVGDLAIISNCASATLFRVSGVNGTVISHAATHNSDGNFQSTYAPGATPATDETHLMKFQYVTYYVGDTGRVNTGGDPIYALFMYDMDAINDPDGEPIELIEGVENMQVLYGLRSTGGIVSYVQADDPQFIPSRVHSIQVGLLMASIEGTSDQRDERTYQVLNTEIGPAGGSSDVTHLDDFRVRMAFNTTVKVRNRRADP